MVPYLNPVTRLVKTWLLSDLLFSTKYYTSHHCFTSMHYAKKDEADDIFPYIAGDRMKCKTYRERTIFGRISNRYRKSEKTQPPFWHLKYLDCKVPIFLVSFHIIKHGVKCPPTYVWYLCKASKARLRYHSRYEPNKRPDSFTSAIRYRILSLFESYDMIRYTTYSYRVLQLSESRTQTCLLISSSNLQSQIGPLWQSTHFTFFCSCLHHVYLRTCCLIRRSYPCRCGCRSYGKAWSSWSETWVDKDVQFSRTSFKALSKQHM